MGVLKDALHAAVVDHLRTQRNYQTLVLSLNSPASGHNGGAGGSAAIRTAWNNLKENGKEEGIKKATGLQAVLKERLDIFHFHINERGHNLITLTPSAQEHCLDPASGLPPKGPAYIPPVAEVSVAGLSADPTLLVEAMMAAEELQAAEASNPGLVLSAASTIQAQEPTAKKQKTGGTYTGAQLKGQGKMGKYGYQDIIWTPEMAAHNEAVTAKDAQMARALFNACELHGGKPVTISQLGSNHDVNQLKKDPQFRNAKLIDILRHHDKVFELMPDSAIGGFVVRTYPGAGAALPDAETFFGEMTEADLLLPTRIQEPRNQAERMQALRVELCHVLHKRGGKCQLNELGQDQKIQAVRKGMPKSSKLIDFVKQFPGNFTITSGAGVLMDVFLASADCSDQSMIENGIERSRAATERFRETKGKGRGTGERERMHAGRPGSVGTTGYDPQAALAQSAQTQYLHALAQQSMAAAYGAYGGAAVAQAALPPAGYPGSPGFGFGRAI